MGLDSQQKITEYCNTIRDMLIEKNIAYGDSALNPIRIFAKSNTDEQLRVRIDDKLNRIMNGKMYPGDNDIDDLIGYLILLKIADGDKTSVADGDKASVAVWQEE